MPDPINCYRCGQPGYTDWIDVRRISDREPQWRAGEQYCTTDGCTDLDGSRRLVALTPAEYASVRADGKQFVVLPDHWTPEIETLVLREERYWVVRKNGEAGAYVEATDPRSRARSAVPRPSPCSTGRTSARSCAIPPV